MFFLYVLEEPIFHKIVFFYHSFKIYFITSIKLCQKIDNSFILGKIYHFSKLKLFIFQN